MKIILIYLLFAVLKNNSQEKPLTDIMSYPLYIRGISEEDVTIPSEFFPTGEKSPTGDVKFILPIVKEMMTSPLSRIGWIDSMLWLKDSSYISIVNSLFGIIYKTGSYENKHNFRDTLFLSLSIKWLSETVRENQNLCDRISFPFTKDEIEFIRDNLDVLLSDEGNSDISDIFLFNKKRDSLAELSKNVIELLGKTEMQNVHRLIAESFVKFYRLYKGITSNTRFVSEDKDVSKRSFHHFFRDKHIKIAIGGYGSNTFYGDFDLIIDLGGNDVYRLKNYGSVGYGCIIIDIEGNDYYSSDSFYSLAGAFFSASYIFDRSGDDIYESHSFGNLGSAVAGLAVLIDENGNDTYRGFSFSTGAGCFGLGLVIDRNGNDVYIANSYSQGFGFISGCGAVIDIKGNDSYIVDPRSVDMGRYEDHYISMCQGYGFGLRPFYAGGVGLIIEGEGNDTYNTDIFGQGGAYWYSLGLVADRNGNDKYNGYQYSQGAGIHLAVGLLKDYNGWDFYQSNGVSQGCGHDFGFGLLWDGYGNDNYSVYSLSQGAGNANGIGIFIDESGTDGYLNKFPSTSRGYGNSRRESGSLGIFIDAEGSDYYSQSGMDSSVIISSDWGIFTDLNNRINGLSLNDHEFKIAVDSNKEYSIPDYFTMAKTIEPRFSHWKDFGFRKLVNDSMNTAEFLLSKFKTSDHREVQVFRTLASKIPVALSEKIAHRLMLYLKGAALFTEAEIAMMCYIAGETRHTATKYYLLDLTYDPALKIRSSAVNALGKINYNSSDTFFIKIVTDRLNELYMEKPESRLYRKDIAFAFSNYVTQLSYEVLFEMLTDPYYGVRLAASEGLGRLGNISKYITGSDLCKSGSLSMIAFIHSLNSLPVDELVTVYKYISKLYCYNDEAVIYNIISLMKSKLSEILSDELIKLLNKANLNVR